MSRLFFALIIGTFGLLFTGCLDDDNDTTRPQYLELGITKLGPEEQMQVVTDSDLTLEFASYPASYEFEEDTRVMLKYSVNEQGEEGDSYDYLVDVYSVQDVVLKDIVELNEENRDTIGTDQLVVNDVWVSGGFLNIDFTFYGDDKTHYINVVKDPDEQSDDPSEVHLQIRHDARDDEPLKRYRGMMSFYLEALQVEGEDMLTLIFADQGFYADPFTEIEVEYEYGSEE